MILCKYIVFRKYDNWLSSFSRLIQIAISIVWGATWFTYLLCLNSCNSTRKMPFGNYSCNHFNVYEYCWSQHSLCTEMIWTFQASFALTSLIESAPLIPTCLTPPPHFIFFPIVLAIYMYLFCLLCLFSNNKDRSPTRVRIFMFRLL